MCLTPYYYYYFSLLTIACQLSVASAVSSWYSGQRSRHAAAALAGVRVGLSKSLGSLALYIYLDSWARWACWRFMYLARLARWRFIARFARCAASAVVAAASTAIAVGTTAQDAEERGPSKSAMCSGLRNCLS